MPIDINNLRTYRGGEPEKWRKYMADRFKDPAIVDQVIAADDKWRETTKLIDHMRRDVNKLQKEVIAPKKKAKEPCDEEVAQMKALQKKIKTNQVSSQI